MLSKGAQIGNLTDKVKRKKRKKDDRKKEDGQVDIVAGVIQGEEEEKEKKDKGEKEDGQVDITAGVIQGDVSAIDEVRRKKRKKDKKKKEDGQVDIEDGVIQVYFRAHRIFRSGKLRKWTEEEYEMVRKFREEHGHQWTVLADELGKHPVHIGNAWQRIKLENRKIGEWDQEEIQKLFDLVNTDLRLRLSEEKKSKHGMLRDNICWSAISDNLSTRITQCCFKWYRHLTSPVVAAGEWADTSDCSSRLMPSLDWTQAA
ncbi:hypothetical protein HAX54_036374 [Datura stramonium]|uniref:Myb-like domain-containing protein n=1 Tax=Datura stramonium TaxID=4076 RepID=A0ABS8VI18_DATST|nr:hypothetical protein [Datura stramonium]